MSPNSRARESACGAVEDEEEEELKGGWNRLKGSDGGEREREREDCRRRISRRREESVLKSLL